MGIYLFKREALLDLLDGQPLATDFGKEIFPRSINTHHVQAHLFDGYWEDLGTIKAYHEANLALAGDDPPFDFHSPEGVIYTRDALPAGLARQRRQPEQCLISDGCVIRTRHARRARAVVGVRSRIGQERHHPRHGDDRRRPIRDRRTSGRRTASGAFPDLAVGDGAVIERAILDKDCRIGNNVQDRQQATGRRRGRELRHPRRHRGDPKAAVVPDGTVI